MKLWIASDTTNGAMYDAERFFDKNWKPAGPIAIANKYGRAETGEIIHIFTEIELMNTRGIDDIDEAREIAERYAVEGHQVEIRDAETGETVELLNINDKDE